MSNKSDLFKEAVRCSRAAQRASNDGSRKLFEGLALFYSELAKTEPEVPVQPSCPPVGLDLDNGKIAERPRGKR